MVLCYRRPVTDAETQWRIVLEDELVGPEIKWLHKILGHPGRDILIWTMEACCHYVGLRSEIEKAES